MLILLPGTRSYNEEHWLEAADHFERALTLYAEALSDCYLLCEDGINVNLTQPNMNFEKKSLYEKYGLKAEMMEYNELLIAVIKKVCCIHNLLVVWQIMFILVLSGFQVLSCRINCHDRMAVIEARSIPNYLSEHFNYLQFCYYKREFRILKYLYHALLLILLPRCSG